jgi:hypothetical protein
MYTKLTTMTWSSADAEISPVIESARAPYINNAITAGTTDGSFQVISPTVTTRPWLDQTSADAWSAFISEQAASIGATCDVFITDIV